MEAIPIAKNPQHKINSVQLIMKHIGNPLLLAAVSVCTYLISFQFQAGYFEYFGIPNYFVSLDLISIVNSLLLCAVGLLFTINVISVVDSIKFPIVNRYVFLRDLFFISTTLKFSTSFLINLSGKYNLKALIISTAIYGVLPIVVFYLYKANIRVRDSLNSIFEVKQDTFWGSLFGLSFFHVFAMAFCVYIVINTFFEIGYFSASTLREFNSIRLADKNYVVIARNGNELLLLPFDSSTKIIKKELHIHPIGDLKAGGTSLNLKRIKSLTLEE